MTYKEVVNKVKVDVRKNMRTQEYSPMLTIGVTNDKIGLLTKHQNESDYCNLCLIAYGDYSDIVSLQDELASSLDKVECVSGKNGNEPIFYLYIATDRSQESDILNEYDEDNLLGKEYPLSID